MVSKLMVLQVRPGQWQYYPPTITNGGGFYLPDEHLEVILFNQRQTLRMSLIIADRALIDDYFGVQPGSKVL
jgi:hypothetical protein